MADNMPKWAAAPSRSGQSGLLLTAEALEDGDRTPESWHVDEKAAYMLGRNGQAVDICVAHKSASRVHACLAYDAEEDLFLVDLNSAHGEQYCVQRLHPAGMQRGSVCGRFDCLVCVKTTNASSKRA